MKKAIVLIIITHLAFITNGQLSSAVKLLLSQDVTCTSGITDTDLGNYIWTTAGTTLTFSSTPSLNDIIIIFVSTPTGTLPTTPTDYTLINGQTNATMSSAVYWKRSDGTETSVFIGGNSALCLVRGIAFSGCVTSGNPYVGNGVANGTSSESSITLSTTSGNCYESIVFLAVYGSASTTEYSNSNFTMSYISGVVSSGMNIQEYKIGRNNTAESVSKTLSSSILHQEYALNLIPN